MHVFPERGSGGLASPRRGALSNKTGSTLTLEVWNVSTRRIVILSPMSLFHAPGPTFFKSMGNFALNTVPTDKCLLDQSENAGSSTAIPRSPPPTPAAPQAIIPWVWNSLSSLPPCSASLCLASSASLGCTFSFRGNDR